MRTPMIISGSPESRIGSLALDSYPLRLSLQPYCSCLGPCYLDRGSWCLCLSPSSWRPGLVDDRAGDWRIYFTEASMLWWLVFCCTVHIYLTRQESNLFQGIGGHLRCSSSLKSELVHSTSLANTLIRPRIRVLINAKGLDAYFRLTWNKPVAWGVALLHERRFRFDGRIQRTQGSTAQTS